MVADMRDRRRGVMIMPPVRTRPAPIAPQRQSQQGRSSQPSNIWELGQKMAAEGAAEQEQGGGGNPFGRGLGFLVNNPVTQNVLKPLEVLDYGRRASILGTEYAARALPQDVENALAAVGVGLPILAVDESKSAADDRSAWEKFRDPTYGWGQVGHTTGNKWLDRGIGLAGDVALDPLTYLTFGAAPLVKGTPTVGRAARFSRMGEAADALRAAGKLDEPAIQMLRRVGERGYSAADAEMLRAMGLQRSGARLTVPFTKIESGRIPFTGGLARGINTGTGAVRGAVNRGRMSNLIRAPKELETATRTLTRAASGSNDEFLAALTDVQFNNLTRSIGGVFKGLGSEELKQRTSAIRDELNDTYNGNLGAYLDATELDPNTPTQLNALSARLREIAAEKGVEIPELRGMGYLPHVLSPEFRELLHEGGDRAKEFMSQTGIRMDDTLRESGFLQARALRPEPNSTLRIHIGDNTIELKTGSINEINEKVKEIFPELKTTALETDPMTMFERYITGTARDVGNRGAFQTLHARGNPFVALRDDLRYEPLVTARDDAQAALQRIEARIAEGGETPEMLRERRIARERLAQAEEAVQQATYKVRRGQPRPLADDEVFKPTLNVEETSKANEQIFKQAASTADESRMRAEAIRLGDDTGENPGLVEELSAIRNEIRAPMSARARRIPRRVQELEDQIADVMRESRSQAWQKRRVRQLAQQTTEKVQAEIDQINKELRSMPRRLRKASAEEQMAFMRSTSQRLNDLRNEGEALMRWYDTGIEARIDELTRGLREAQAQLDEAMNYYRPTWPEGITPDEIVARAEAIPSTTEPPGRIVAEQWGPTAEDMGGRPVSGAMDEPLAASAAAGPPPEAAALAGKNLEARRAYEEARAEVKRLQDILDRPQVIEMTIEDVSRRLAAIGTVTDANVDEVRKLGQQVARLEEELPKAKARIRAEGVRSKLQRAEARAQRLESKLVQAPHPRLPYAPDSNLPPEIKALQERVAQEELNLAGGTGRQERYGEALARLRREKELSGMPRADELGQLRSQVQAELRLAIRDGDGPRARALQRLRHQLDQEIDKARTGDTQRRWGIEDRQAALSQEASQLTPGEELEQLRQAQQQLRTDPESSALLRRINALTRQIPATEEELMRGLRGEGVIGEIASDYAQQEASRGTSLRARREQLKGALREIPEDLQREIDNIQANQDELAAYANELASNQAALLQERSQLRAAVDASPTRAQERTGAPTRASTRGMTGRSEELINQEPLARVIDEIETMARLNPGATDESLNVIEAQLQMYRRQLEVAAQHDLKANQAMDVAAAAKDKNFVKVYTAMLQDGWKAVPGQPNTFVRSELRRMMLNAEQIAAEPGLFGSTVQALTNFFKTYATLSPGFHVRNALSATFMNTTDGVALRNQLAGVHMWRDFVRAKDPLEFYRGLTPRWQQAFDAVFATGAGGRFFESGVAEATAIGRTRLKEGIFRNKATILSQRAGQRVEGSVRLGMALDTIKNGGSLEDAINRITRVHFDYSQVSKFDENMKRLIPFWTFMSRNLPLQFTQMWMKPKVYNWYKSLVRNVGTEAPEFTPEYITEGGGFNTGATTPEINIPGLGTAAGMPIFASPDFAQNRYEGDVARLTGALQGEGWGQILSDFNPYLTAPIEYATDRDLFTGRTYQPDDWRKASGITDMAMLPLMALTGQTRRGGDGDIYYQEKGIDAYRSMIPILDRISRLAPGTAGGEANDRQLESMLRFLGVPIRTISEKQMQNERRSRVFDARDQRRLEMALGG